MAHHDPSLAARRRARRAGAGCRANPPEAGLSLAEAVKTALAKHPALRAAAHQAAAAGAGVDRARAGFLPQVDFSEGITRSDQPVYAFGSLLNQGRFTSADFAVDRLNHPDSLTNWRTNIAGSVPLFMGGRTVLGYQQAHIGLQAAERGRDRVEQEVIFGVVRAYHGALLAQEAQATVDVSVRAAEANLAAANTRYQAGLVVASDALSARVRLARLKEEAIATANQVRLASAALNDAMGLPLDQPQRITGRLDLPPARFERLEGLEATARERGPDYRQAVLEEQRFPCWTWLRMAWKHWATSARLKTPGRVCACRGKGMGWTAQSFPRVVRSRHRRAPTFWLKTLQETRRSTSATW